MEKNCMGKTRKIPRTLFVLTLALCLLFYFNSEENVALSQESQSLSNHEYEYYPHHPTGCRYIKRLGVDNTLGYYFIQPCNRDNRMWLQQVTVVETRTEGVIYLQGEPLINGLTLGAGYWCSLQAPGFKDVGVAGVCTEDGWISNRP
jgi:hypothetical protein